MFNQRATGARWKGQGNNTVKISSTAFAEDVNTHHSVGNKSRKLDDEMQQEYIQYKKILKVSGGKLLQQKCTFYALDMTFLT
jgi:hypothetical protein